MYIQYLDYLLYLVHIRNNVTRRGEDVTCTNKQKNKKNKRNNVFKNLLFPISSISFVPSRSQRAH